MNQNPHDDTRKSRALSELPVDELILYGCRLGLQLNEKMGHGQLLRLVRQRQELLIELDREALLDIVIWARRPVRESASKEELAEEIATIKKMKFDDLGLPGLIALAKLRNVPVRDRDPRVEIEAKVRACEPLIDTLRRKRRQVMGSLIGKIISGTSAPEATEYHFLPEDDAGPSLQEQITDEGVVGGIARKIRGVADDYVREKLDEIETRIDRKLDEIDQRLAEWRDREIANRLKIIKITLLASILVALISLGYKYLV
ncbi:MAG: hypothetical protein ACYTF1_01630 [Planctomycetota bacterium]